MTNVYKGLQICSLQKNQSFGHAFRLSQKVMHQRMTDIFDYTLKIEYCNFSEK